MIEALEQIDRSIVLAINSLHTPFFDEFMWIISLKITWIPLYILIFYLAYRKIGFKLAIFFAVFVALCLIFSDIMSSQIIKESVQRFRPSHHFLLQDKLHFYQLGYENYYKGGLYGFVSSHASNFFVIAVTFCLTFKKHYFWFSLFLFFVALINCYSRLYLGVHYLTDIIGGAVLGTIIAFVFNKYVWKKIVKI